MQAIPWSYEGDVNGELQTLYQLVDRNHCEVGKDKRALNLVVEDSETCYVRGSPASPN